MELLEWLLRTRSRAAGGEEQGLGLRRGRVAWGSATLRWPWHGGAATPCGTGRPGAAQMSQLLITALGSPARCAVTWILPFSMWEPACCLSLG